MMSSLPILLLLWSFLLLPFHSPLCSVPFCDVLQGFALMPPLPSTWHLLPRLPPHGQSPFLLAFAELGATLPAQHAPFTAAHEGGGTIPMESEVLGKISP